MKIIEAMRKIKANTERIVELQSLISANCALQENDTPPYQDQMATVTGWLTAVHDLLEENENLKVRISRTNSSTQVSVEIGGERITKSITQWIYRRDSAAKNELNTWRGLTDRKLQVQAYRDTATGEPKFNKVKLFFSPELRDKKVAIFAREAHEIDGAMEIANATIDLVK